MANGFPADELIPLECKGRFFKSRGTMDDILGNFSLMVVDSLDTLAVMGEWDEFIFGAEHIINSLNFTNSGIVSVFETNIRMLGGLLSIHLLILDKAEHLGDFGKNYNNEILDIAIELADRMLPAFDTPTGIPCARVHLIEGPSCDSDQITTAEAGTLLLEMGLLSELSGNPVYKNVADKALGKVWEQRSSRGIVGSVINVNSGKFKEFNNGIGAGVDSFYEYLFKSYILFGDSLYLDMFNSAYATLLKYNKDPNYFHTVNSVSGKAVNHGVQGLSMFFPGLEVLTGNVEDALRSYAFCMRLVSRVGFPPECSYPEGEDKIRLIDPSYVLRPEFVESTLYLYRATKNPVFQLIAKQSLKAIREFTKNSCGFSAIGNLLLMTQDDRLDTFFFSETLKYIYLIFDEDNFANKEPYLFTTEAHLIPLKSDYIKSYDKDLISNIPSSKTSCPAVHGMHFSPNMVKYTQAIENLLIQMEARLVVMTTEYNTEINVASQRFGKITIYGESGLFGGSVPKDGIKGFIFPTDPLSACPSKDKKKTSLNKTVCVSLDFFDEDYEIDKGDELIYSENDISIAVALRGGCFFAEKALEAEAAGARALLIVDNVHDLLFTMSDARPDKPTAVNIPSILIPKHKGDTLLRWIELGEILTVTIYPH